MADKDKPRRGAGPAERKLKKPGRLSQLNFILPGVTG
jgi:hypothetical protein